MGNIVFVILHYETLDDTRKCVDSLTKYLQDPKVQIVLVDNGSANGRLASIEPDYKDQIRIHFLRSEENLGFAKGNNIGYRFAKEELNAQIIILANNDLVFEQEDFIEKLLRCYEQTAFDVAGPRILSLMDGKNQNPVAVQYASRRDINKRILKDSILRFLSHLNLDKVLKKFVAKEIPEVNYIQGMDFQLHGACMFFANRYLVCYDGLYDKTFMYGEENILKYIVKRDGLKMEYLDDLCVYHKEGSSTGAIYGKGKRQRQFYYKWNLDSCKKLRNLMKADDKRQRKQ